jgi:predicted anti-sigma-YlaC factor YlaD
MRLCDELLDHLDDAAAGALPPHLEGHLRACDICRRQLDEAGRLRADAGVLAQLRAPRQLVARLKAIPRLAPACDAALELVGAALDGEIDGTTQARLLDHLHDCPSCLAAWEAFATLHEVGSQLRAPQRLRTAVAVPPRHRLALRRRRPLFDLRLATAAAYLLAAATIVLVSNPATVARASSATVERAGVYARAAVENRLSAYSRRAKESIAVAADWLQHVGADAYERGRDMLGLAAKNRAAEKPVEPSGQGGKQP